MSRSKHTKTYPMAFMDMLAALHDDPSQRFEVEAEDWKAAKSLMMSIHSFRSAAEREEMHKVYPEVSAMYVNLLKDRPGVMVMHRDYSPEALMMQKALDVAKAKKLSE